MSAQRGSRSLRGEVSAASQHLHARGWVANHDGNVTARDGAIFIATPTATSKRLVDDRNLLEVDNAGKVVAGTGKVFGEISLHLAVYTRRPDVNAVVHAHPPFATAIASSPGNAIERPFIAEAVVSLGALIPKVPFAMPGDAARDALAPWCEQVDAVLLGNHGVLAWGASVEQALLRLELVEHLARIAHAAAASGGIAALPDSAMAPLLAARAKAGLGRAADKAVALAAEWSGQRSNKPVVACAPAPHAPNVVIAERAPKTDVASMVREEIVRALRGS